MISLDQSIYLIQYSEIVLLAIHLFLLYFELKTLYPVRNTSKTNSLIGFLVIFGLVRITRIVGISLHSILIRTYISALLSLIAILLYIDWVSVIIHLDRRVKMTTLFLFVFFMLGFMIGRDFQISLLTSGSLVLMIVLVNLFMIQTFRYVFKTSPYVRARHRLFVLSISFILYIVLEGFAVTYLGDGAFYMTSILLLCTIPARIGITISILLPNSLSDILIKFIN